MAPSDHCPLTGSERVRQALGWEFPAERFASVYAREHSSRRRTPGPGQRTPLPEGLLPARHRAQALQPSPAATSPRPGAAPSAPQPASRHPTPRGSRRATASSRWTTGGGGRPDHPGHRPGAARAAGRRGPGGVGAPHRSVEGRRDPADHPRGSGPVRQGPAALLPSCWPGRDRLRGAGSARRPGREAAPRCTRSASGAR
jgi:hypothetical protein